MADKQQRERKLEARRIARRKRLLEAQERQREADLETYGERSGLLDAQESSSGGDARGGIWDISVRAESVENKSGTDERIQNDGIDEIEGEEPNFTANLCQNGVRRSALIYGKLS